MLHFAQRKRFVFLAVIGLCFLGLSLAAHSQELAKRLILKDGSYQLATKWEVKGDRVRYYSAEREDWEEVPNSFVDWPATDKFEKDRAAGTPSPEAVALDRELEEEQKAEEARTPEVAPGLRLTEDASVVMLDTFETQPQLIELQQSGGEVNRNMKGNILRAAINPIATAKQTIELPGLHAKIQAHAGLPSIYVNLAQQGDTGQSSSGSILDEKPQQRQQPQEAEQPWDRFHIVRLQPKQDKRIVGDIKIAVYGKVSQDQKLVTTTATRLTGSWVKVTPTAPLTLGEYAVVEMLGKDGMNLYVWDFGVNPAAPANTGAWKPDPRALKPPPDKPKDLEKRQ
jgi:hypothetical protein